MGIGGSLQDSTISDVWIQHVQAGIWMTGPFTNLKISNVRIQDTVADGINFDGGVTNSSVTNTYIRNTGDDGIALWSNGVADANDAISHDTVQLPVLANNFAIYGGSDNSIVNDYATDTITQGGGIQVGNRFSAVPLSGTTTIADNTLVRAGTLDPNWKFGVGAIWFYASDGEDMTGDDQRRPQHDPRQPVRRVRLRRRLHPQRHPARLRDRQRPHQRQPRAQRRHVRVPAPVGRVGRHHLQRGLHRDRRPRRDDGLRLRHHR